MLKMTRAPTPGHLGLIRLLSPASVGLSKTGPLVSPGERERVWQGWPVGTVRPKKTTGDSQYQLTLTLVTVARGGDLIETGVSEWPSPTLAAGARKPVLRGEVQRVFKT